MSVRILITGGTFDKEYDEIKGQLYFKDTHMREILELGRSRLDVKIRTLMLVDSLDMTDADRLLVLENCRSVDEDQIVVTHGTDTMIETGEVLAQGRLEKTIVLTGAMIPYKFGSSDGLFNFGGALAFAQTLPHGVYVAMNGRYFNWNEVQKNKKTGIFEEMSR
jgi:L-asparaginase